MSDPGSGFSDVVTIERQTEEEAGPTLIEPLLRALVDLRDRQIQKARIQFSHRLAALERGDDTDPGGQQTQVLTRYLDLFQGIEKMLDEDIAAQCDGVAIVEELIQLKGISHILAAKLASMIEPGRAPTVSSLWRFAGFGVVDGKRERSVKGERRHYNVRLKTACYLIATSFLRCNSPYRAEYDRAKAKYQERHPDWTKLHVHHAAMGNMIKLFLAHLWERWRRLEGLPIRQAYCAEYQGHTSLSDPGEYGWPVTINKR